MKRCGYWLSAGAALALICLLLIPQQAEARYLRNGDVHEIYATRKPYIFHHNVGLLELMVTNVGIIGNPFGSDFVGAGWRGGEFLYAASLWVGAVPPDNLSYVSTGAYEREFWPEPDPEDTIYKAYEGVLGGNRIGFSRNPDDDNDGLTDEDYQNGQDDDGDGLTDEDFEAISQQMFSCEYRDYADLATQFNAEHRPLNLRVQQRSFAWSTPGSDEFVGFEFTIWNDGFETLRDVFIGYFVDSDAGPKDAESFWTDDGGAYLPLDTLFVDPARDDSCGIDTLNIDICYMYDIPDNGNTATGGDTDGYFGGMFLGHTTDPNGVFAPPDVGIHTAHFFSSSAPYPQGDPRNDFERYDLLSRGTVPTRPTTQPSDYRYAFSAGPFAELLPGEKLTFQTAFVIGSGLRGMSRNAVTAQRIYNGRWRDVDGREDTGIDGRELCLVAIGPGEPARWSDPCTDLAPVRVIKETECIPENYVDDDCDGCTPDPLCEGCEELVRWVGSVAPPAPLNNTDELEDPSLQVSCPAGDRQVTIEWDNISELTADPTSQKIYFRGYQIWVAQNWDRPAGSIGPSAEDWELVADLSLQPPDSLGEDSPMHLRHFTDSTVVSPYSVLTGASGADSIKPYYPVGRYRYVDSEGLQNGKLYFYDVIAYSVIPDENNPIVLEGKPTAVEDQAVIPVWDTTSGLDDVYVVPNPHISGQQPSGWDLEPSDTDPTGTKVAFVNLPPEQCNIKIYTLAGDLVETIDHNPQRAEELGQCGSGTAFWNLITRNGQDVVGGVYLYSVNCGGDSKVGRLVLIR
ncbi:MAG: hypothetical protein GF355_16550 [Candidatus Eisenbacteria bacterium]|nr:hypothetical protein [Candidatus Eisenbacteria bacterium]